MPNLVHRSRGRNAQTGRLVGRRWLHCIGLEKVTNLVVRIEKVVVTDVTIRPGLKGDLEAVSVDPARVGDGRLTRGCCATSKDSVRRVASLYISDVSWAVKKPGMRRYLSLVKSRKGEADSRTDPSSSHL